ncbi:unnamed protein product [Parnassius apollo]|uniref:(apollo) hypothetical protein n=1 Tax=Parnassius apollo TaxID=110799 RepID=A0A8S3XKI9_PARAO|nr:unnamed protein product [Parnassius apollo]
MKLFVALSLLFAVASASVLPAAVIASENPEIVAATRVPTPLLLLLLNKCSLKSSAFLSLNPSKLDLQSSTTTNPSPLGLPS